MKLVRMILAVFVSAGLIVAPVQAANAMRMMPMASMVDTAAPPADQDCACCNIASRCLMVVCATYCVQFAPASDATFCMALLGHSTLRGFVPSLHNGLIWQPPTPPPRA
jgi:hypothetical protein